MVAQLIVGGDGHRADVWKMRLGQHGGKPVCAGDPSAGFAWPRLGRSLAGHGRRWGSVPSGALAAGGNEQDGMENVAAAQSPVR